MLRIIYCNPLEYIEKNLDNHLFILPDSISIRNVEIYFVRKRGFDYFPVEKFHTIDSLALSLLGKKNIIIPRFMERYLAKESLKDISYHRKLHDNENFITILLEEYMEIRANMLTGKYPSNKGEFFSRFDERYSKYLEKLMEGVIINGSVMHFYTRYDLTMALAREISTWKGRNIAFVGFYYIDPTLKHLFEKLREKNEVSFISEPLDDGSSKILNERLAPDEINKQGVIKFNSILYELPDMRREVKFIANLILQKMKDEALNYSDFVVAFPDAKRYQWYVEEIFSEYGIPYFMETRIKFRELSYFQHFLDKLNSLNPENMDDLRQGIERILQELILNFRDDYEGIIKMWQAVEEFFIEINALSINEIGNVKEILISYLSTISFGRYYGDYNTVPVVDLGNVHFRSGTYLIIGGMNEENFPRPLRGNLIFQNETINLYRRDFKTHEGNEKYRLFSAINYFRNVVFTFPYFSNDGRRVLHSYLIDLIRKNNYSDLQEKRLSSSEIVFSNGSVFSERDKNILEIRNSYVELDEFQDPCSFDGVREIVSSIQLTPSHITTYNKCPRKFFFTYVLGIRYPEEPLSPVNQGNFAHQILSEFYSRHKNLKEIASMEESEIRREIMQIADKVNIEHEESSTFKLRVTRQIVDSIMADVQLNSERRVIDTEIPFKLQINSREISGRIDRLDRLDDYNIIVDYKYSKLGNTEKMFIKRKDEIDNPSRDLNLPIYILWLLKVRNERKFMAYYIPIISRKRGKKNWLNVYMNSTLPKGFTGGKRSMFFDLNFISALENKISGIIKGIEECSFPKVEKREICIGCEYRRLCGDMHGL